MGVRSSFNSEVNVLGNVIVNGAGIIGLEANESSKITVNGNLTTTGAGGTGAKATGGSQITINGTMTVRSDATYIVVGTTVKTQSQYETTTTKAGYLTYTDGTNTVWVRGEPAATAVTWSGLTANGTSGTVTTTALTLTFNVNPSTLTAENITVTGATRGTLTGTGTSRSLPCRTSPLPMDSP